MTTIRWLGQGLAAAQGFFEGGSELSAQSQGQDMP